MIRMPKLFKKTDTLCIISVLLLSIIFFSMSNCFFSVSSDKLMVKIEANGLTEYYPLDQSNLLEISANNIVLTVRIENNSAWIEHSNCPDGICRSMGKLNKNGQIAVCAPAEVAISIYADAPAKEDTDAITR